MNGNGNNGLTNDHVLAQAFLFNLFGHKAGVVYVPESQKNVQVKIYGEWVERERIDIIFIFIGRVAASVLLPFQNFRALLNGYNSAKGRLSQRFRRGLINAVQKGQYIHRDYANWISWFEGRVTDQTARLADLEPRASLISVIIFYPESAGFAKTVESLDRQILVPCDIFAASSDKASFAGEYVALLQAGEILSPDALLILAETLIKHNFPMILMADEDEITTHGTRLSPHFKPQPSLTLICSGTLSRGIFLVHKNIYNALDHSEIRWAEAVRLRAWFQAWQLDPSPNLQRTPHILTHRAQETLAAPPEILARVVESFLGRTGFRAQVTRSCPLLVSWELSTSRPPGKVSILVPSRLQGEKQIDCIIKILETTSFSNFEMIVLVMQPGQLDSVQDANAARIGCFENAKVVVLPAPSFNYSVANNFAATLSDGEFICLLNDDVAPMTSEWLSRLLGFFQDPHCGVVGPRLLYPDLLIQHAGVIIGLSGLADHAFRFLASGDPGYGHRAVLDQEYCAVTGACLLVRRSIFDLVGGFDESYASAFNDVDFCLRVREQGFGIIYAGSTTMIHHESLTFEHHYAESETLRQNEDVARFRARWAPVLADDPYYNPNLSLDQGMDWQLTYPPRT